MNIKTMLVGVYLCWATIACVAQDSYSEDFDYFVNSRNRMRFISFFNPAENDTNLEFDGKGYGDGSLFGR